MDLEQKVVELLLLIPVAVPVHGVEINTTTSVASSDEAFQPGNTNFRIASDGWSAQECPPVKWVHPVDVVLRGDGQV